MIFSSFEQLQQAAASLGKVALTIGNFDGVHCGHQDILARLKNRGCDSTLLITFSPYPFEVFKQPTQPIVRIYQNPQKFRVLEPLVDNILNLDFREIMGLEAEAFIAKLCSTLNVKHIIIGDDFHFGKKRLGNILTLEKLAPTYNYSVESTATISIQDSAIKARLEVIKEEKQQDRSLDPEAQLLVDSINKGRYSSTLVRQLYQAGYFAEAKLLLQREEHPQIRGVVKEGRKLARQLKVPTANISIGSNSLFKGSYVATVRIVEEGKDFADLPLYPAVCNIGYKPTVNNDEKAWLCEAHLLDFTGDLYGKELIIEPQKFCRYEQKFASLEELKAAIFGDIKQARLFFNLD